MKFKALKSFVSSIGTFNVDEDYDVKLDKPTSKMWIEHGLIEETKDDETQETKRPKKSKKSVKVDENK